MGVIACAWIGVGAVKPSAASAWRIGVPRAKSENVVKKALSNESPAAGAIMALSTDGWVRRTTRVIWAVRMVSE
jgi:hypothetical protein